MKPYYDEGGITIYHGDAFELLPELGVEALVVTDPPYFQPANHYVPARLGPSQKSVGDLSILQRVFSEWCVELARLTGPRGTIYFFCDGQSYPLAFTALYPFAKRDRPLVWDKVTSYNGYTWRHQHELVAWAEMAETARIPTGDGDILRYRAVKVADRLHPAQKPADLVTALIDKHPGCDVLDPFVGSGTTLVAAKALGRRAVGVEIEERYCEIAVGRLAQEVLDLGEAA